MDEMSREQMDADVLQSKADILRARSAGLVQTAGGPPAETAESPRTASSQRPLPPALRPLDAARAHWYPAPTDAQTAGTTTEQPPHTPLPAALRPLSQTRVGAAAELPVKTPDKPLPAALRPLAQVHIGKHTPPAPAVQPPQAPEAMQELEAAARPENQHLQEQPHTPPQPETPEPPVRAEGIAPLASAAPAKDEPDENPDIPDMMRQAIPRFNLGEQILAEQRRAVASRRQKTRPDAPRPVRTEEKGIDQVVEAITANLRRQAPSAPDVAPIPATSLSHAITDPDALSAAQQQIIADIVARDIERLLTR